MTLAEWWQLAWHFMVLSLLAVGGAITTAPDIHRFLVDQTHWLGDEQFNASISIAQAAPGPNVLFVPLMGWQAGLGLGHGSWLSAVAGMLAALIGILLPSSVLMWTTARWLHQHRNTAAVRAFKAGLAPVSVALILSTSWLLMSAHDQWQLDWRLWLLSATALIVVWRTNVHLLAVLATGALLGAMGLV